MGEPRSVADVVRAVADALPAVLAYVDTDERYLFANAFCASRWGRPVAEVIGRSVREVLGDEVYARVEPDLRRALRGETVSLEVRIDGSLDVPRMVSATFIPDRALDGTVRGVAVFSEDLASQHAAATLDAVVQASPTAVMLLDLDGTVRMWNAAAERIFGWSAAEVLGTFLPAIGPEERDDFVANLARVADGNVIDGVETRRRRRDGPFDAILWAAPVRGAGGKLQCLSIVADVTQRRRQETARRFLAEAGRLFASSLDLGETLARAAQLPVPAYADWTFVDLLDERGDAFDRVAVGARDTNDPLLFALKRRYALAGGRSGVGRAMKESAPQLVKHVDEAVLAGLARDAEHLDVLRRLRMRSFASAPLVARGRAIGALSIASCERVLDEQDLAVLDELARSAAAAIDNARLLTRERSARNRIARMQEITAALSRARTASEVAEVACRIGTEAMSATSGGLWLSRADGALELAGAWGTPAEFMEPYRVLLPGDARFPALRVLSSGEPLWVESEDDYRRASPEVFAAAARFDRVASFGAVPLLIEAKPAGVVVFSHRIGHHYDEDERGFYVTLAHHCGQAIERARLYDEAQRASRVKDEFLAMLGHELRNPLAPIRTALEVMKLRDPHAHARERDVIDRQVRHLTRLVDDLLDVSRAAHGRMQLERARVDLEGVLGRAVEIARPQLDARKHALEVHVASGSWVLGDATRLAQVFANLLGNAAKYTRERGRIVMTATRVERWHEVSVRDNGVGIAPELLPRVFELFTQGPQAPHRPEGGLGLGLAIVRSIVTLHGGTVEARSEGEGKGTEIVVRLPAAVDLRAPTPVVPLERASRTGTRVLVVDDNEDAAELLEIALSSAGFETRVAHHGREALAVLEGFTPEVAVLDIGLPGMDGIELAGHLRTKLGAVRLIALSGYGLPSDRDRTRAAGFAAHLVKPVDLDRLERTIVEVLSA